MDNSIYVTLSREMSLFRDLNVSSNNIANANTTGYHADHIMFNTYVTKDISDGQRNKMDFAYNASTYRDTRNGSITMTGNDLDVAIEGNGYFILDTPLGERYTRAGNFRIDSAGTLVSSDGYPVVDATGQHINLPENLTSITIGSAGNLKVNGEDIGAIGIVKFDNPQLLERLNGTMFKSDVPPQPADDFQVSQRSLESSNVQPITELTHIMQISQDVSDSDKFIQVIYGLEDKAATAWTQQA